MTLANRWPHEGGEFAESRPHDAGDRHAVTTWAAKSPSSASELAAMRVLSFFVVIAACGCGGASHSASIASDAGSTSAADAAETGGDSPVGTDAGGTAVAPVLDGGGAALDVTDAGASAPSCNPVQPYVSDAADEACPSGDSCRFNLDFTATECTTGAGKGTQGDGCFQGSDCAPGYDCVVLSSKPFCARFCRYGGGFDDCGSDYTCTPYVIAAFDGAQEIGTCM
jgi:hypothetical protein